MGWPIDVKHRNGAWLWSFEFSVILDSENYLPCPVDCNCWSDSWASAISSKCMSPSWLIDWIRDSNFATTFSLSGIWRISVVNWLIRSKWRNCLFRFFWFLEKYCGQRFVVSMNVKETSLEHITEVFHSFVRAKKFTVMGTVLVSSDSSRSPTGWAMFC